MDVALQLDPVQLETGQAYSVFAIGSAAEQPLGGNALEVLIATDAMLMPDTAIADDVAAGAGTPIVMVASLLGLAAFIVMMVTLRPAGARR